MLSGSSPYRYDHLRISSFDCNPSFHLYFNALRSVGIGIARGTRIAGIVPKIPPYHPFSKKFQIILHGTTLASQGKAIGKIVLGDECLAAVALHTPSFPSTFNLHRLGRHSMSIALVDIPRRPVATSPRGMS